MDPSKTLPARIRAVLSEGMSFHLLLPTKYLSQAFNMPPRLHPPKTISIYGLPLIESELLCYPIGGSSTWIPEVSIRLKFDAI